MINRGLLFLFLLSMNLIVNAQLNSEKIIYGFVRSDSKPIDGISVFNFSNKLIAVSNSEGRFSIKAKQGDLLIFSGIDYKKISKYIYSFEYYSGKLEVNMAFNAIELDEVVINKYAAINAENLGIIPKGQIRLTAQERRLYSGSDGIQGLYNWISGEKEVLRKNLETEKKETLLTKLEYLFDDQYYVQRLKIPHELIKGFQYYCIEDQEFVESIKNKNKTMSMFLITNLAMVYNNKRMDTGEGN